MKRFGGEFFAGTGHYLGQAAEWQGPPPPPPPTGGITMAPSVRHQAPMTPTPTSGGGGRAPMPTLPGGFGPASAASAQFAAPSVPTGVMTGRVPLVRGLGTRALGW